MTDKINSPLLLFYPTSPVHVRDMQLLMNQLPDWRCTAILYRPLERIAPGIEAALLRLSMNVVDLNDHDALDTRLPRDTVVLALGAVFEPFALDLFVWAKLRQIPVIAIEEVAQLALNQLDIDNYDAPFDRLFVASQEEYRGFSGLGYRAERLRVSGLLANDRVKEIDLDRIKSVRDTLGIVHDKNPIVYTTSPLRSRLSVHNKDDLTFRKCILNQLAESSSNTGRSVVIKLHPNENIEKQQPIIQEIIPNAVVVGRELSMDDLLPIAGVLVNRGNSQTCLDAVLRGIPTVIAACGLTTLFHTDDGAYLVENISDLSVAIKTALANGPRDHWLIRSKHFFRPAEGVAHFIANEIGTLIEQSWPADEKCWNWLIRSILFIGRHDRALGLCGMLPSRSPWQELVRLALQAHFEQRISDATSYWLQCAAVDPEWYFPHYELAHGYQATGQFPQAIAHAQKAIELHPPFHSLWHEIPMRAVIMASLRNKGELEPATAELKALEERGLVEIVPELLIEAAAQHCSSSHQLEAAERCLEKAVEQLKLYPVDQVGDRHIIERAAKQCVDIAEKYAEIGNSEHSAMCLVRALEFARLDATIMTPLCSRLAEFGEKREIASDYLFAKQIYALAVQGDPTAYWLRYQQSRHAWRRKNPRKALKGLVALSKMPNAARAIIEKVLSPAGAARLEPYWPASSKSIVKPLTLWLYMTAWFCSKLARSGLRDIHTSIAAVILVWLFVARHFVRRLRDESSKIRRVYYAIRSFLLSSLPSRGSRVANCPICGARGKFEYQNKQTDLFRCLDCDHVWAFDLPDDQALNALYGDFGYWERDRYHQGITAIQEGEHWQTYLDARIGILCKLKLLDSPVCSTKKVFEIGCAEGMLLHELHKRGMEVMGCEMNQAVAAEGMKALGINILTSPFETIELPADKFDLVMSFHTVEHLRDPALVLAKVAHILHLDGALLLEVPCGEEEYENTDHLHFFSETSLRTLLNKFFRATDILDNSYTNSSGVRIGSIYGVGRGVRSSSRTPDE